MHRVEEIRESLEFVAEHSGLLGKGGELGGETADIRQVPLVEHLVQE